MLPAELDAGYRVLLDEHHLADTIRPPMFMAYVPQPPFLATYQTLINDSLSDATTSPSELGTTNSCLPSGAWTAI